MKINLLTILFLFGVLSISAQKNDTTFHMPAEWEPQQAVWVGLFGNPARDTVSAAIIKALHQNVQVRLNYSYAYDKKRNNKFFHNLEIDTTKLQWIEDSLDNAWVRDPGPLFIKNNKGEQKVIDFTWIQYGHHLVYKKKLSALAYEAGRSDIRMAAKLNLPVISTPIIAEGGGIETNGAGVSMSIEETALQRNPGKTLVEIEAEYLRVTGCKKMIWLKRMMLHDKTVPDLLIENWTSTGANGHIDEAVRFVETNTIVVAQIDEEERNNNPISKVDYEILEEYCATLKKASDVNGKPFKIIRMPAPDLNVYARSYVLNDKSIKRFSENFPFKTGDTVKTVPSVSYMNFFISNNVVLVAKYWKEGMPLKEKEKDEAAKRILAAIYPDRKIIQINPLPVNYLGGGIHCITQQQPE